MGRRRSARGLGLIMIIQAGQIEEHGPRAKRQDRQVSPGAWHRALSQKVDTHAKEGRGGGRAAVGNPEDGAGSSARGQPVSWLSSGTQPHAFPTCICPFHPQSCVCPTRLPDSVCVSLGDQPGSRGGIQHEGVG